MFQVRYQLMRIDIPDDITGLKNDMAHLQSEYGIDDSLIESLINDPRQARAHISFWKFLWWTLNALPALIGYAAMLAAAYWYHNWNGLVLFVGGLGIAYYFTGLALKMRLAINKVVQYSKYHHLI